MSSWWTFFLWILGFGYPPIAGIQFMVVALVLLRSLQGPYEFRAFLEVWRPKATKDLDSKILSSEPWSHTAFIAGGQQRQVVHVGISET